jgi:hypothetical protein
MYEIVRDTQFEKELAKICGSIRLGDDFINSCEWRLSRNPRSGKHLDGDLWWVKTANDELFGRVIVFYTFSKEKEQVFLLSMIKSNVKKQEKK